MYEAERDEIVAAGRRLVEAGLVVGGAGNVSVRRGDHVVITGRGARLGALTRESCVVVDLDGTVVDGDRARSSETPLHLAVYGATDAQAVVHTHPLFGTVLSTLVDELAPIHYAVALFGGPVRVAGYATFGSDELAEQVRAALEGRRGALMRNHGAVTIGERLEQAVELNETLEWLAAVHHHAHAGGTPALLGAQELEQVDAQRVALSAAKR